MIFPNLDPHLLAAIQNAQAASQGAMPTSGDPNGSTSNPGHTAHIQVNGQWQAVNFENPPTHADLQSTAALLRSRQAARQPSQTANFDQSLKFVLAHEGGYSNDPADPGGATMHGVTQRTYNTFRKGEGKPVADVRNIAPDEVRAIYKNRYWNAIHGDQYSAPLATVMLDAAVNHGPQVATSMLAKAKQQNPGSSDQAIANSIISQRRQLYHQLIQKKPAKAKFANGWNRRMNDLQSTIAHS